MGTPTKLGDLTITKKTGTELVLSTEGTFVATDVSFDIAVQSGSASANTATADASVQSDSSGRNISGSIGSKSSSAPQSGKYIKLQVSGSGSSKVTTAGWLATGGLSTASTTVTEYFPVSSSTVTQNAPSIDSNGVVSVNATATEGFVSATTVTNSLQLSTVSATTYTPSTSNQTISSGKYITGTQTIKGDANLLAENIRNNTSIFGVVGTLVEGEGVTVVETLDTHGGTIVTITSDAEVYGSAEEVAF